MKRKRKRNAPPAQPSTRNPPRVVLAAALAILVLGAIVAHRFSRPSRPIATASRVDLHRPTFVGSMKCAGCHQPEFERWQRSHHRLAMQPATDATVLGNFARATFTDAGLTSIFFRDKSRFVVRTEGPDGAPHDYPIRYTFGVSPLQQYLIELDGGRLQTLDIAWDSRPAAIGGQRWFSLHPGSRIAPSAPSHWTGIDQNWNSMCADCHSTNVRKNYNLKRRSYATTYAEIEVGCEACHGPGSNHLAWAGQPRGLQSRDPSRGLAIALDQRAGVSWRFDPSSGEVRRDKPRTDDREVEMCARCHSRRTQIHEDYVHGQPLANDYRVALLDEGLYFADGQIEGEVYEYGSFLQSRMFHDGVTCSDCHEPHGARLRAEGNALCTRCHLSERYDSPRHHFHPAGSAGTRCVECHMPARTYMTLDRRRDHSLRVPRPDLSRVLGVPNACNQCHSDKTSQWAADKMAKWYSGSRIGFQKFGRTLMAGRVGAPGATSSLAALASDDAQPAIARATALAALSNFETVAGNHLVRQAAGDKSALIRRAAADLVSGANPNPDASTIAMLLTDPVRTVRIEAVQSLADLTRGALPGNSPAAFDRAVNEYLAAQALDADRPEAHLNLAIFFAREGRTPHAESELRTALAIDPSFSPAAVNLADLLRSDGRDDQAETVLRHAMQQAPNDASLMYATGLLKVRQKRKAEALGLFAAAARLAPRNSTYAYAYALALNEAGSPGAAIQALEQSLKLNPYNRDSLAAIVNLYERVGDHARALEYSQRLNEVTAQGQAPGGSSAAGAD